MSDYCLIPQSPLGGFRKEYNGVVVCEVTDQALVSVAIPQGGKDRLAQVLQEAYQLTLPETGRSSLDSAGTMRVLGMQPDQLFLLFRHSGDHAVESVRQHVGALAYYTDQSDSVVMLEVSGSACRAVLARICLLDLHPDAFPEGAVTRTLMEHLGVVILRTGEDAFLLMTLRSSALSLLHAVEVSIVNVV